MQRGESTSRPGLQISVWPVRQAVNIVWTEAAAMAGWLKGLVKEIVSGDTVVVVAATAGPAVPPEKRLTLSSLVAPRLVRRP